MAPRPDYLARIGGFVAGCRFEDLPDATVERARWVIADCIAVTGAGAQERETRHLAASMVRAAGSGEAPVIGTPHRAGAPTAAFLNGTAGTFLELDEGNQFCRGHPGIHVVPAALAEAQLLGASGRDLILAVALGYEIGARVGIASRLRMTMHPHGTWGTVGAAITVAKLHGYAADEVAEIVNIASTLGLATSRRTMLEGGTVRNGFAGISNQLGITAHHMARAGFEGERDGLATVYGSVIAEDWRPEEMTAELGARWEIARNYFKRHACCRYNHATLDALREILDRRGGAIDPASVISVEVETYSLAAQLSDPAPRNMLAAKFSVPFAVATFIAHQAATVEAFRERARGDAVVRALAERVTVREDPMLTAMVPARRPARIRIVFADGGTETAETATNRGDTEDPYTPAELEAKFFELAEPVWGPARSRTLFARCMGLDRLPDIGALAAALPAEARAEAAA